MSPMGCRFGDRCNFAHGQHELRQRGQPASQSSGVRAQNGPRSTVLQSSSQARTAWPNPETHPQSQVGHVSGAWNSNAAHTPVSGTVQQGGALHSWAPSANAAPTPNFNVQLGGAPANTYSSPGTMVYNSLASGIQDPSNTLLGGTFGNSNLDNNSNGLGGTQEKPAHGWTQHTAPEGFLYYHHAESGISVWERPPEMGPPVSPMM
mmetsp:Transcript_24937/g.85339  ORF Transcript_24937/g.85339 Transcript_24937/m.85339 type:complete len:206 (+) Transcript_24937:407-1024(+)